MREIGTIQDNKEAALFCGYLASKDIECQAEEIPGGGWSIWILDDDHVPRAGEELADFMENPKAPRYAAGLQAAIAEEKAALKASARSRAKEIDGRTVRSQGDEQSFGFLTIGLIILSVGSFFIHHFTDYGPEFVQLLSINSYEIGGGSMRWLPGLPDVMSGQIWRLLTPIFIHFTILHIIFNMMWLNLFGNMIEKKDGTFLFACMVLVFGIASNLGQYFMVSPSFGGMSGVNYGLFGYIWIRSRHEPSSDMFIDKGTVVLLVVWFLLGYTGFMNIANTAHAVGLFLGLLWGTIKTRRIPFTTIRF